MITKQDLDNMTPEELEEFKRQASIGIVKKFGMLFLFKLGTAIVLWRWAKKLRDE